MNRFRSFPARAALALLLLASAGSLAARPAGQEDAAAEIVARIDRVRDLLREEGKWAEALNLLTPLLAQLISVPDTGRRIELSAEVFLLRGIASAGLGDEAAALREFRSLYALGPEASKPAVKNIFDPKILPLLKRIERESQGEEAGYFLAVVSDPAGAKVWINGREVGETPVLFQADGPGKVLVELRKSGYQAVREETDIKPGGTRREYPLVPVALSILARSLPPGAKILLDGEDTGRVTEAEISGLSPGPHKLRLELPAYRAWEGAVELTPERPRVEVEPRLFPSAYLWETTWGGWESTLLKSPSAICPGPGGTLVVVDASEQRIHVFDEEGRRIGGPEAGNLVELGLGGINGLAVDATGRILLSDPENHAVFLLRADGRLLARWGSYGAGPGELNTPAGLAVDEEERVYIADSGNDRIQIRTLEGIPAGTWGGESGDGVSFQSPRAIAVRGGRIYVLDLRQVHVLDKDGILQSAWEPRGPDGETLSGTAGVTVDDDGCVYVSDSGRNRIVKYDPAGEFVCTWGAAGTEAGEMDKPVALCLDVRERIVVADSGNHRLQLFRAVGLSIEKSAIQRTGEILGRGEKR